MRLNKTSSIKEAREMKVAADTLLGCDEVDMNASGGWECQNGDLFFPQNSLVVRLLTKWVLVYSDGEIIKARPVADFDGEITFSI